MADSELVDLLAGHKTLGGAPRSELEWLASHGVLRHLVPGDALAHKGVKVEYLFIILTGRTAMFVDRGAGPDKVMEWAAGEVTGILPYSRLAGAPGEGIVQEPTTLLALHADHLRELTRECPEVTAALVHTMLDRARQFKVSDAQVEKMASLGKLSAGLAHELNNPVAAIERSAALLTDRLRDAERSAEQLNAFQLTPAQFAAVERLREACLAVPVRGVASPLDRARREEAIADWVADHQLDPMIVDALVETPVTTDTLDRVAEAIDGPALNAALRWTAAGCSMRTLASEIQEAATRISGLVIAVKGFTHMDQAQVAEPVDLMTGLDNTIMVLRAKARRKSATIAVRADDSLPRVRGFAGELNQIWSNLIDNALDAIPDGGRVDVLASRKDSHVLVRVIDNGTGIPEQIQKKVFDPFFTTKPMGEGTGVGLDIVRRLVQHNDGHIEFDSQPGRTEFRVLLQVADAAAGAGA